MARSPTQAEPESAVRGAPAVQHMKESVSGSLALRFAYTQRAGRLTRAAACKRIVLECFTSLPSIPTMRFVPWKAVCVIIFHQGGIEAFMELNFCNQRA